jgi:hypothetical protein
VKAFVLLGLSEAKDATDPANPNGQAAAAAAA